MFLHSLRLSYMQKIRKFYRAVFRENRGRQTDRERETDPNSRVLRTLSLSRRTKKRKRHVLTLPKTKFHAKNQKNLSRGFPGKLSERDRERETDPNIRVLRTLSLSRRTKKPSCSYIHFLHEQDKPGSGNRQFVRRLHRKYMCCLVGTTTQFKPCSLACTESSTSSTLLISPDPTVMIPCNVFIK